jgi:5-oxoprolinase (ATP-hydrolysing)
MSTGLPKWSFFVDTGGTFTDCFARSPDGSVHRAKVLSRGSLSARISQISVPNRLILEGPPNWPENFPVGFRLICDEGELQVAGWSPQSGELVLSGALPASLVPGTAIELLSGEEAPILGQRLILARAGLSPADISASMRLATTRCTNALLEGAGDPPVFFVTQGFPDLLEIGDQRRLGLFDLVPRKRSVLHGPVVEVCERLDREGKVLQAPDLAALEPLARELLEQGNRVAVVSFLHSYVNDAHEQEVARFLKEWGFPTVICSAEIRRFRKWLPRSESSVVEAYLSGVLTGYLDSVEAGLGQGSELLIASSAGGLSPRVRLPGDRQPA